MPVTGDVTYARGTEDDPTSGLYADRDSANCPPGYYSVPLTRYGIRRADGHGAWVCTATPSVVPDAAAKIFDLKTAAAVCATYLAKRGRPDGIWPASLDGLGQRPAGLLRRGVLETPSKNSKPSAITTPGLFRTTDGEQVSLKVALRARKRRANLAAELPMD